MKSIALGALLAVISATSACTNTTDKPRSSKSMSLDSVPNLPRVDAKTLLISDIQVNQFANPQFGGAIQPLVDFRYTGLAEYVEVMTCNEAGAACSEAKNVFQTQSTLANGPSGTKIVVKLRACVDPARAIGSSNCGDWFQTTYMQWAVIDKEKSELQAEYESIQLDIKELVKQMQNLLKLKQERANKCKPATPEQKALLDADRSFAESLGKLGQSGLGVLANGIAMGSQQCKAAKAAAEAERNKPQETATTTSAAGSTDKPATTTTAASLNLGEAPGAGSGGNMMGAINLPSLDIKSIVDKLSQGLQDKAGAMGGPDMSACITELTASKQGRLTLNDVGAVLPNIATAVFDLTNADRKVALEGICIGSLGQKLEASIEITAAAVKSLASSIQARSAKIKAKLGGAGQ